MNKKTLRFFKQNRQNFIGFLLIVALIVALVLFYSKNPNWLFYCSIFIIGIGVFHEIISLAINNDDNIVTFLLFGVGLIFAIISRF